MTGRLYHRTRCRYCGQAIAQDWNQGALWVHLPARKALIAGDHFANPIDTWRNHR